ncbi:MAG: GNAT family N-acetyltransferase [Paracoccaceae bacterium]
MATVQTPIPDFATTRLSLRRWRLSDGPDGGADRAQDLDAVLTPRVMQHLPEPLQRPPAGAPLSRWVEDRLAESDLLVVRAREDGRMAGLLILAAPQEDDRPMMIHVGYLLGEAEWGKGLASELVAGLVAAAQTAAPLRLIGGVGLDNPASARVLQKVGFRRDVTLSSADTTLFVCDI